MADCKYLEACPIFTRFRIEGLRNLWIGSYCKGWLVETCERKKLKDAGDDVPELLLPNGRHLDPEGAARP